MVGNRNRPDLNRLRQIQSPERFLWAILPHAARTFSACITMLPAPSAKAAAVGYSYCRILDTYEDLAPTPEAGCRLLQQFASRFGKPEDQELSSGKSTAELPPSPRLTGTSPVDHRDQAHLLLVERCDLIDRVFQKLPPPSRVAIVRLIRDMAGGMIWAKRVFDDQGGVLRSNSQLRHYCNAVLGNPVAFAMRLMIRRELNHQEKEISVNVGELIQLANVTRDIEKDLRRGVAYHPALKPWLNKDPKDASEVIREVRSELFDLAMLQAPAYREMIESISFRWISLSRASSMLMLDFTDRYYRSCAKRVGRPSWPGPQNPFRLLMGTLPAFLSRRATLRRVRKVEKAFLNARQPAADLH